MGLVIVFVILDIFSSLKYILKTTYKCFEGLLMSKLFYTPNGWSSDDTYVSLMNSNANVFFLYTHAVRRLMLMGTPKSGSKSLMNPWSSYLYLASSCYPNVTYLHIVRCSLAWWFRIDSLYKLRELVLEECEIDESGIEILANYCSNIKTINFISTDVRISHKNLPYFADISDKNYSKLFTSGNRNNKYCKHQSKVNTQSENRLYMFPNLKEIVVKSCNDVFNVFVIYLFLSISPKLSIIRFTDSIHLKKAFYPSNVHICTLKNETWNVITATHIKEIKKFWRIP